MKSSRPVLIVLAALLAVLGPHATAAALSALIVVSAALVSAIAFAVAETGWRTVPRCRFYSWGTA